MGRDITTIHEKNKHGCVSIMFRDNPPEFYATPECRKCGTGLSMKQYKDGKITCQWCGETQGMPGEWFD